MAKKTAKIDVALSANAAQFKQELAKAEKETSKFSKGASKAFSGLKMAGIGVAAGLGAAFMKAGLDFEAMENILIKGTGASGQALEDLKTQATDVLRTVPETAEVVAGAIADVNTFFGATGDGLEATTGLFLDFARVTDMDVGDAIARLDAQMTQFGIPLEETDELLGDLVRIAQATGAPMDTLLNQMEKFGPIFATAAFTGEETAAMFGMLERAGVDVAKLGPSLEKFFGDVAEAGGEPRQAFEDMVAQIASAETETEALALASDAFGTAGARMTSAIRNGNLELETFGGLMGDGTGLVDAQASATETLSDKFAILKNDLMSRLGPAAVATMEAMMVAIDGVVIAVEATVAAIQEFAGWFDQNLMPIIRPIIDLVVRWFEYLWKQIQNVVDLVVALFQGDFAAAFDALKDIATTAVDFMVDTFKDLPGLLFRAAVDGLSLLTSLGKQFGKAMINGLIEMWNKADITVPRFDVPEWIPGVGGKGFGGFDLLPDIATLAAGGIVTGPTLALLGEAGPEAIIPLDHAGGGRIGGAPMTVNVYLPVGSDGDAVVRALQEYEARNGPVPVGTRSL
jgi:phage-related minor tail protein